MILGQHWKLLCQAISHLHSQVEKTRFVLKFDPAQMTDHSGYRIPIDRSFMEKTAQALLEPLQKHWRGIELFEVDGLIDANLGEAVKTQVAERPWSDYLAWLSRLEEKSHLVEKIRQQGHVYEANAMWENISSEASWVPHRHVTASPILCKINNSIVTLGTLGELRCFLHVLRYPPPHASDQWYKDMVSHAYFMARAFLMDHHQQEIRAQFFLFKAQLQTCVEVRTGKRMDLVSAQRIASILVQAEEMDLDNEEIREEQKRFLDVSGLERLTIREIATAL